MPPSFRIRVAISGGGIAGAALLHGLSRYSHLDLHIFESASAFQEAGAAIGLSENALQSLDLLSPTAGEALVRAGAVPQSGVRVMLGEGPEAGAYVGELAGKPGVARRPCVVHRAAFVRELLAGVDPERMHTSKKLAKIQGQSPLTLVFEDGTTHECDVLVGADGLHSFVRKYVLGEDDPAAAPTYAGWWAIQSLQPLEKMQKIMGNELVSTETPQEYGWVGNESYLLHNVLSDGSLVQLVACGWQSADEHAAAKTTGKVSIRSPDLKSMFQTWPPNLYQAIQAVWCSEDEQPAFTFSEHPHARTYIKGLVAVVGDAAHTTTPWQASGAGMSIEDASILAALIGGCADVNEARNALRVYDKIRLPRTRQIVESSNETGHMLTGRHPETGLDKAKLQDKLLRKWEFIVGIDMEGERTTALKLLKEANDHA